jgi:capsular polysaccharide biosynthesis protein
MDIWRILSAIIRRWYLIIPLLVATVAAAVTIGDWIKPEYQTSAIISIVPGKAPVQPKAAQLANPYLAPDYTTGVLQYVLSSSSVRQDLLAAGFAGSYVVKAIPRSSFIGIDVTTSDPELAIATERGVIARARLILAKRQSAIEAGTNRVSIDVLDNGENVSASTRGQLQALAAVLAVGGIVSVVVTVLIDDLLILRRRRLGREADLEAATDVQTTPVQITPSGNGAVSATGRAVAPVTRAD